MEPRSETRRSADPLGVPGSPAANSADVGAALRSVLGRVPTSVGVVAGIDVDGRPVGLAVGSFTSVSLDPPLVAFCPGTGSASWPRIRPVRQFCVNLLAADQRHLCEIFASKSADKFADLHWQPAGNGAPRLPGAVAHVECELEVEHEAGDHTLVIGRVTAIAAGAGVSPLVFLGGRYFGV